MIQARWREACGRRIHFRKTIARGGRNITLHLNGRLRKDECALDKVLKLADVARPLVARHFSNGLRGEVLDRLRGLSAKISEKVVRQNRYVLAAKAQRRQGDREHIQA